MPFDPTLAITSTTVLGWRTDTLGALDGTRWTMRAGATPGDAAVVVDGASNVVVEPGTALGASNFTSNRTFSTNMNFRCSALVLIADTGVAAEGSVRMGVLAANGGTHHIFFSGSQPVGFRSVQLLSTGATSVINVQSLVLDTWYRIGLEKIGTSLRGYWCPTPNGDRNLVADVTSSQFVEFARIDLTNIGPLPSPYEAWVALSGAGGAVPPFYNGISDFIFSEVADAPTTQANPNTAAAFSLARGSYATYKTLRQAVNIYNNLSLGP